MFKIIQKVFNDDRTLYKYICYYFYDDVEELKQEWWDEATGNKESCYDNQFIAYKNNPDNSFHIVKKGFWLGEKNAWRNSQLFYKKRKKKQ